MKLAKTNRNEIDAVWHFLNELAAFDTYDNTVDDTIEADATDFPILSEFNGQSLFDFIQSLRDHVDSLPYQKVLFNCQALLDNCADPNQDVLDFKPEIKEGLVLLKSHYEERGLALLENPYTETHATA